MFANVLGVLELLLIIIGTWLVLRQIKMGRDGQFSQLWLESEKDFVELNKLMLGDKVLRDTYRLNDPVLKDVDDDHLKKFVFYELYYSHLSRVYQMFTSAINPYHKQDNTERYWDLYLPMLKYYAADPVFVEVHNSAKSMQTFSPQFVADVEKVLQENLSNAA